MRSGLYQYCFFGLLSICHFSHSFRHQIFHIDKLAACITKSFRCLLFTKAVNCYALLLQPNSQRGKITITRYEAKTIKPICIKQIHCIDNHEAVGSIFTRGISKLLHRLDGMFVNNSFPFTIIANKVAIDTFYHRFAEFGGFFQDGINRLCRCIIGINQYR